MVTLASASFLAACGDETDEVTSRTPAFTETVEPTATPSPAPTLTVTPTPTIPPATEEEDGGDEAGNRVDLHFDLFADSVEPSEIAVPAFLGLRVRVRNQSGAERLVRLRDKTVLELLPGQSETFVAEGLRPGEHLLEVGESGRVTIVAERAGG